MLIFYIKKCSQHSYSLHDTAHFYFLSNFPIIIPQIQIRCQMYGLSPEAKAAGTWFWKFDFLVHEHETEAISKMKVTSKGNLKFFVYIYQTYNRYLPRCIIIRTFVETTAYKYLIDYKCYRLWGRDVKIIINCTINVSYKLSES